MRLFTYGLLALTAIFVVIAITAHSDISKYKVRVAQRGPKTANIEVLGVTDNLDGTLNLGIDACGTTLIYTLPKAEFKPDNNTMGEFVNRYVDQECSR